MEPISKALSLKAELDDLRPLDPEQGDRIMQKFRLDWNYHSNRLEGNSLTFGETKALILFGITAQGKPLKDHLEIEGHNEAIEWVLDIVNGEYQLTEKFIRELHTLLLKESYSINSITADGIPNTRRVEVGKYKSQPNHVLTATGEMFYFASPEETPAKMEELLNWYRAKSILEETNPIFLAAEFHYKFIRIHPFDDGNGRTARILMNFIFLKFRFPPVIIKTEDKQNYLAVLQLADSGQIEPFVNYIAENLVRSLELMIRGAKGEDIEEPDDFDKELLLLKRRLKGTRVNTVKSADLLRHLLIQSVTYLLDKFEEGNKKFNVFYLNNSTSIYNETSFGRSPVFRTTPLSDKELDNLNNIKITTEFKIFKYSDIGDFNFSTQLRISLSHRNYTVSDYSKSVSFTHKYNEQLKDDEINDLVKSELKRHKAFIEEKMKARE